VRADAVLLAEAALQVVEGDCGALLVCDGDFRVLASGDRASEIAGLDATAPFLRDEVRAAVLGRLTSPPEGVQEPLIVRLPCPLAPISVHVRRLDGALTSAIALTIERVPQAPNELRTVLGDLGLSVRERQLVALLRRGYSNRAVAAALGLTEGTVKIYLHHLFRKLDVDSRMRLVARIDELVSRRTTRV